MSKFAAKQSSGKERIKAAVVLNMPQKVGKSSELMPALTDTMEG